MVTKMRELMNWLKKWDCTKCFANITILVSFRFGLYSPIKGWSQLKSTLCIYLYELHFIILTTAVETHKQVKNNRWMMSVCWEREGVWNYNRNMTDNSPSMIMEDIVGVIVKKIFKFRRFESRYCPIDKRENHQNITDHQITIFMNILFFIG